MVGRWNRPAPCAGLDAALLDELLEPLQVDVVCLDEKRVAHAGEMVAIPHDRPRSMSAKSDVTFLWTLALETDATASER
jgi:ethanolamine utilization protein EutQ (cupin superfamily)